MLAMQQLHEQQVQSWPQHRPSIGPPQLSGDGIQIVVNDVDHVTADKKRASKQKQQEQGRIA